MSIKIIAEIGANHNGSLELAKQMIVEAKLAGADIAKFQTAVPELVNSRFAPKAAYQIQTTGAEESQLEMCRRLCLHDSDWPKLIETCKENDIEFLSTPFDRKSVTLLVVLGQRIWKIPSGEITNLPLLIDIARLEQPILLSTGMSTLMEVEFAVAALCTYGARDITLLHCNTQYPTPLKDANLRAMCTLRDTFHHPVGYSDHTRGIEAAVAAAALGATVIEKHFTLSNDLDGPDQEASLEPKAFAEMVRMIRCVEAALGDGVKQPSPSEKSNIPVVRKSIVACRDISKGELLSDENLEAKRPGTGISPIHWFDVLGTKAIRDFATDEPIELGHPNSDSIPF